MGANNKPYKIEDVKKSFERKNYTLLSTEYINTKTKLNYICNKHKELGVQQTTYTTLRKNINNCKLCIKDSFKNNLYKKRNFTPKSSEEFYLDHFNQYKKEIYDVIGNEYSLLDTFKGENGKHMFKLLHNICKKIYVVERYKFLKGNNRCQNPECKRERKSKKRMKPISRVKKEIFDLVGDEYLLLGSYKGTNINTIFYHKVCKNTFWKSPHNFFAGQRCPHCIIPTKGEQRIIDFLKLHNQKFIFQYGYVDLIGTNGGELSYDFYLTDYNLLIEYQGQFHDGTALKKFPDRYEKQKEHDKRKREYAESHNIKLLEIWYWDFDNIESILTNELKLVA